MKNTPQLIKSVCPRPVDTAGPLRSSSLAETGAKFRVAECRSLGNNLTGRRIRIGITTVYGRANPQIQYTVAGVHVTGESFGAVGRSLITSVIDRPRTPLRGRDSV